MEFVAALLSNKVSRLKSMKRGLVLVPSGNEYGQWSLPAPSFTTTDKLNHHWNQDMDVQLRPYELMGYDYSSMP